MIKRYKPINFINLDFQYEDEYFLQNIKVAGIDEAGRGALAGPVVAAAVILNPFFKNIYGINDSKQLIAKKRYELFDVIIENSITYGIASVDNNTIDKINILQATLNAMETSIQELNPNPGQLLIDGNYFKNIGIPYKTIIGGDSKCLSIASASILAKVTRDRFMVEVADPEFPEYGFADHKGYGTKKHFEALKQYGFCKLHRMTFLKKFFMNENTLFSYP